MDWSFQNSNNYIFFSSRQYIPHLNKRKRTYLLLRIAANTMNAHKKKKQTSEKKDAKSGK